MMAARAEVAAQGFPWNARRQAQQRTSSKHRHHARGSVARVGGVHRVGGRHAPAIFAGFELATRAHTAFLMPYKPWWDRSGCRRGVGRTQTARMRRRCGTPRQGSLAPIRPHRIYTRRVPPRDVYYSDHLRPGDAWPPAVTGEDMRPRVVPVWRAGAHRARPTRAERCCRRARHAIGTTDDPVARGVQQRVHAIAEQWA